MNNNENHKLNFTNFAWKVESVGNIETKERKWRRKT